MVVVAPSGVWASWKSIWDSIECHGDWNRSTAQSLALEADGEMPLFTVEDALASTPRDPCQFATIATRNDVAWGVVANVIRHVRGLGYSRIQLLHRAVGLMPGDAPVVTTAEPRESLLQPVLQRSAGVEH